MYKPDKKIYNAIIVAILVVIMNNTTDGHLSKLLFDYIQQKALCNGDNTTIAQLLINNNNN